MLKILKTLRLFLGALLFFLIILAPKGAKALEVKAKRVEYKDVKSILDSRCVVCHGCYSSPCNLKLDSYYGCLLYTSDAADES